MAFTYTPFATDKDRVRFHIGDVDSTAQIYSDEEINAIIVEEGAWKKAVLACLDGIIARLTGTPDFKADWLTVDVSKAVAAYRNLRNLKAETFALETGSMTSDAGHVYRLDSEQKTEPTYED